MISEEEVKSECLRRMQKLGLNDRSLPYNPYKAFEKDNFIMVSYYNMGILYELTEEEKEEVKEFEKEYQATVYHCIKNGNMLSLLFVYNDNKEYFKEDKECFNDYYKQRTIDNKMYAFCYCCGDLGDIVVQPINGGLKRLA